MNEKVLVVCDVNWWAFDKIYRGLKRHLIDWEIDAHYTRESWTISHRDYDVVLFLCDYQYHLIEKNQIPRDKLILAIRSDVRHEFYNSRDNVMRVAKVIAVSSKGLQERFEKLHDKVFLAPGGVDSDKFYYRERTLPEKIRVGWSGSTKNFGEEFRGIHFIRKACEKLGFTFSPAIREEKMRNEDEMVEYYHNDIDIYVEMSAGAGRQNGLVEAASCGVPVISSKVGVAENLIVPGVNGLIGERNIEDIERCLKEIIPIAKDCASRMRRDIEDKWSWKAQSKLFEVMFKEIVDA